MATTGTSTHAAASEREVLLGRYELARRLGSGGFGTVWLAHDLELDRAVAVKRIVASDPAVATRAQREARAAARLSHPAIVALHEAARDGDEVILVSELVRGRTLARLLADGLLSDHDVVEIGRAMCDALAHAHSRGVVHRDVKPANVLVPDDGTRAKICDFGIAQVLGDDGITRTGDVVGTLAYMAPEQAEGRQVTAAADVYALGLCLYEGLSGTNPVRGRTPAATVRRVGVRLPPLGRLRRDLPTELCAAIDAAVATHPEHRTSLRELKRALRAAQDGLDDEPGTVEAGALEPLTRLGRAAGELAEPSELAGAPRRRRLLGRLAGASSAAALVAAAAVAAGPGLGTSAPVAAGCAALAVLLLGRLGWAVGALVLVAALAGIAPSLAVLAALGAAPVVLALWRVRVAWWSAPAAAPALGLAGLAPLYPALAGQASGWAARALLGALGAWWLTLGEAAVRPVLLLGPGGGPRLTAVDAGDVVGGLLGPALTPGAALLAAAWAVAALVLPWVVRGRSAAADATGAIAWGAGLAAATAGAARAADPAAAMPHGALLGVGAATVAALALAAIRRSSSAAWA